MKKILIIAILPLARFGLPHREGQTVELDENQALEIIDLGYGKDADAEAKAKADAESDAEAKAKADAEAKAKADAGLKK